MRPGSARRRTRGSRGEKNTRREDEGAGRRDCTAHTESLDASELLEPEFYARARWLNRGEETRQSLVERRRGERDARCTQDGVQQVAPCCGRCDGSLGCGVCRVGFFGHLINRESMLHIPVKPPLIPVETATNSGHSR